MTAIGDWQDLPLRTFSAIVLLTVSSLCIYFGNPFFAFFILLLVSIVHWELGKMLSPISKQVPWFSFLFSFFSLFFIMLVDNLLFATFMLLLNFGFQRVFFHHSKFFGALYSTLIVVCGLVFYNLRLDFGLYHVSWLISVVIITDVAGYFTGKMVGGPKVFPKISPNKTWSGVIGGWLAVGLFSLFFVGNVAPPDLFITFVVGSVLLSVAAQIGDIIQSRLKRVREVKDSSNLLPGHGGFMDRLDGFIGATVIIGPFFQWIIQ